MMDFKWYLQEIKNEYGSDGELLAKEFIIDKYNRFIQESTMFTNSYRL